MYHIVLDNPVFPCDPLTNRIWPEFRRWQMSVTTTSQMKSLLCDQAPKTSERTQLGEHTTVIPTAFCCSPSTEGRTVGGSADGARIFIAVQALRRRAAAALAEQIVDNPVPHGRRGRGGGGFPGLRAGQYSTAANVGQIVDIPARGGLQGFRQGHGSSSSRFLHDVDDGFCGVVRSFPRPKKIAVFTRQSSPRVTASVSSSELSAHQMALARESVELADERRSGRCSC